MCKPNDFITFEVFENIINTIQSFDAKNKKISEFIQDNLCESSFVYITHGETLANLLIDILCRYFHLETDDKILSDDITWWLYELSGDKKVYYQDGSVDDLNDIHDFYNYLCEHKAVCEEILYNQG